MDRLPDTLLECVRYYPDPQVCHDFLVNMRWPDGVKCPRCQHDGIYTIATRRMFQCKACKRQFSVKVGTIFEDSQLGLDKWLVAVWCGSTGSRQAVDLRDANAE